MPNTASLLTGTYLNRLISQTSYAYRIRFRKQTYIKQKGLLPEVVPHTCAMRSLESAKRIIIYSGSVFPNPTLALWDGKVCAVLHRPVQSPQILLPLSAPMIWNSQIENWAIKNLKTLPAAYLPLSFSDSFCALSGTTSFFLLNVFLLLLLGRKSIQVTN